MPDPLGPISPTSEPLEICRRQQLQRLRGNKVESALLAPHHGDPLTLSLAGDSGNWPWVRAAAELDFAWVELALDGEKKNGLDNLEYGAMFYGAARLQAKLDLLLQARKAAHSVVDRLASNIRALLGGLAISALPTATSTCSVLGDDGDPRGHEIGGNSGFFSGATATLPAPRQTPDLLTDHLSALLSWAFAVPGRRWGRKYEDSNPSSYSAWPVAHAEMALPGDFQADLPERYFGLQPGDRQAVQRLWAGEASALATVQGMLGDWRPAGMVEIRRTASTVRSVRIGDGLSTFKPEVLLRQVNRDGKALLALPQRWSKQGSPRGTGQLVPGQQVIHRVSAPTEGVSFELPWPEVGAGEEIWAMRWGPGTLLAQHAGDPVTPGGIWMGRKIPPPVAAGAAPRSPDPANRPPAEKSPDGGGGFLGALLRFFGLGAVLIGLAAGPVWSSEVAPAPPAQPDPVVTVLNAGATAAPPQKTASPQAVAAAPAQPSLLSLDGLRALLGLGPVAGKPSDASPPAGSSLGVGMLATLGGQVDKGALYQLARWPSLFQKNRFVGIVAIVGTKGAGVGLEREFWAGPLGSSSRAALVLGLGATVPYSATKVERRDLCLFGALHL